VVERALRDANAWDFVARMPAGLDTPVGEKGARLSGGQKQRLAIARALIRNPRVLILDEATSALDTETETLIQEALARLMHGRTTFVVAHRLSTIRNAHRIVVLDQGRMVEAGSHEALLRAGGRYARLHALQGGVEAT
jgi:ATP-binding cassette subfamily B protein